jgi:hypothetical protein
MSGIANKGILLFVSARLKKENFFLNLFFSNDPVASKSLKIESFSGPMNGAAIALKYYG